MNRAYKAAMQRHNRRAYRRALRWRYVLVLSLVSQILVALALIATIIGAIVGAVTPLLAPIPLFTLVGLYFLHSRVASLSFEDDSKSVRRRVGL